MLGRLGDVKEGDLSGQDETPRPRSGAGQTAHETARPRVRVETRRSERSTQAEKRSPDRSQSVRSSEEAG
jgi:hypothetical protein